MNTKKKNARGITLIALVITIIVLLILAGVTINALSGENGILKRATQVKSKTGRANALEQINLAIITARTEGLGQVDKTVLRDEITKAGMTVKTDGDDLPWEVVSDKYIFRINEDYTVEEISGIGLSKKEIKLASGENETITATLTEGTTGKITWESSAPDIVKVENGKITAVGESGTATITAKVEGTEYQATCTVKIIQKITTITAGNIEMNIGDTQKINVTTTPTEGLIEDLEYTSGSPEIATVGADGNVKGIAEGTAVITIRGKNSGVSTTCTIKVTPKVTKITKITASDLTLEPGKTGKLSVTIEPTNQTEGVTYTSGTKSVATVGEDGTVNALTEGTTIITVKGKVSGVSTTCTVTVKSNKINGAIEVGEYEKYYGKKVTNYTAGGKTYRIFYIDTEGKFGDKNTVYLKADWTANDTSLTASYTPSGTDLATYKKLNPSWAAKRGSSTSSWNENEHAAAWLCSPSKWTTYCDTSKANYAIGSPTAEMYVASYNQVSHTTGNYKLGATYRATSYPGYMYTVNGTLQNGGCLTDNNTLDYTRYNSMYCGKNGSKEGYWWLASPSSEYYNAICVVDGEHANLTNGPRSGTYGVCPLVSLKSDFEIEITLPSTIDAETIAENPGAYYGQKVTNYTAGGKTYRIFYVDTEGKFGDKNTIYLKADWTSNDTSLSDYPSYTPSGTDLEIYKKLNPSWAAQRGSSTSSWNTNEHKAAWLCSPSKWTTYCDTSKANYAIGSPTAEMYVASYNQVSHTTGNYKLGATYRATDYPGYIYTLNGKQSNITNSDYYTGDNTLDYTGYNSMYCGRKGSKGDYWWWLASPSSGYSGAVCNVYGSNATLIDNGCSGTCGVAPLVSLKSGIQVEIEE